MSELIIEKNIVTQKGWVLTTLDEFSFLTFGQSPPSSSYNKKGKGLPFFQGRAEFGKLYPEIKIWCTKPNRIAEKNDVLICVRAGVGGTNLNPTRSCIGRGLASIRSLHGVNPLYILYYLRSIENILSQQGRGSTLTGITSQELRQLRIPVAPLNEQKRIVAKIEELFSKLDFSKHALGKTKTLSKQYRQSLLKSAFEGKLTEKWRKENKTQSEIPEKIRNLFKNNENSIFSENWILVKMKNITNIQMGQSPKGMSYNTNHNGVALLNGPTEFGEKYPIEIQWTTSPTKICKKDDLLFCVRGNTIGRMNWANKEYCIGRGLCAINSSSYIDLKLIFYFLLMKKEEIFHIGKGSTFPNISKDKLENFNIPLMSNYEQKQIISKIDEGFSLIENNERIIDLSLKNIERLRKNILKQAFEGKLVPQDPNDEPAEILLKKIMKEKQTNINQTKSLRRKKNGK